MAFNENEKRIKDAFLKRSHDLDKSNMWAAIEQALPEETPPARRRYGWILFLLIPILLVPFIHEESSSEQMALNSKDPALDKVIGHQSLPSSITEQSGLDYVSGSISVDDNNNPVIDIAKVGDKRNGAFNIERHSSLKSTSQIEVSTTRPNEESSSIVLAGANNIKKSSPTTLDENTWNKSDIVSQKDIGPQIISIPYVSHNELATFSLDEKKLDLVSDDYIEEEIPANRDWRIYALAGPTTQSRVMNGDENWKDLKNIHEKVLTNYSASIGIEKDIQKSWIIGGGLGIDRVVERIDWSGVTAVNTKEIETDSAHFYKYAGHTHYSSGTQHEISTFRRDLRNYNQIDLYSIPLYVGYTFPLGKKATIRNTLGTDIQWVQVNGKFVGSDQSIIEDENIPLVFRQNVGFGLSSRMTILYPINDKWDLNVGLQGRISPTVLQGDQSLSLRYISYGLMTGLSYRF